MPEEEGLKIIFEGTGHKFKLLWINESGGTGQKGNLETQTVLDQCLELPLKFYRRPFAYQSYKRSIHVATLAHTHHLLSTSLKYLPGLPSSLLSFQYMSALTDRQGEARVDITTWQFVIELWNILSWEGPRMIIQSNPWPCQQTPNNPTPSMRALSKYSWRSGSLGAMTIPWGAWAVPNCFFWGYTESIFSPQWFSKTQNALPNKYKGCYINSQCEKSTPTKLKANSNLPSNTLD